MKIRVTLSNVHTRNSEVPSKNCVETLCNDLTFCQARWKFAGMVPRKDVDAELAASETRVSHNPTKNYKLIAVCGDERAELSSSGDKVMKDSG
jgi:hypothetical protein